MKNKTVWIVGGVVVFIILLAIIGGSGSNNNLAQNNSGDAWYYINQNYQCVKAPNEYKNEDSCAKDVGTYCHIGDSTCGGVKKLTLYYIDSTDHCILAPHNPYPPLENLDIDGNFAQQDACKKDVGQNCYADDNTCGGVGNSGTVVIKGGAYKLVSAQELKEVISNPNVASKILGEPNSSLAAPVAVKGIISAIIPWDNKTEYELVINTDDRFVLVSVGTIDVNTKTSNGFHISDFPVGTKVLAGGAFAYKDIDGKSVNLFPDLLASPHIGSGLKSLGLPTNTPVIISMMGTVEIEQ